MENKTEVKEKEPSFLMKMLSSFFDFTQLTCIILELVYIRIIKAYLIKKK